MKTIDSQQAFINCYKLGNRMAPAEKHFEIINKWRVIGKETAIKLIRETEAADHDNRNR